MELVENPTIPRPYDCSNALEDLSQVPGEVREGGIFWVAVRVGTFQNPTVLPHVNFTSLVLTPLLSEPNKGMKVTVVRHANVPESAVKLYVLFLAGVWPKLKTQ